MSCFCNERSLEQAMGGFDFRTSVLAVALCHVKSRAQDKRVLLSTGYRAAGHLYLSSTVCALVNPGLSVVRFSHLERARNFVVSASRVPHDFKMCFYRFSVNCKQCRACRAGPDVFFRFLAKIELASCRFVYVQC